MGPRAAAAPAHLLPHAAGWASSFTYPSHLTACRSQLTVGPVLSPHFCPVIVHTLEHHTPLLLLSSQRTTLRHTLIDLGLHGV